MEYVDPIKNVEQINKIKKLLLKTSKRDLLFFVVGINTGIKISDLLFLKVEDVWDGEKMREFLTVTDERNGEIQNYYLNHQVNIALENFLKNADHSSNDYLFKSKKNDQPITRQQAYRIINAASKEAGVEGKIGTHTLRKTFGYHAYRKGIAISILMSIFHHQSPTETLHYIGIDKSENRLIKVDVNL